MRRAPHNLRSCGSARPPGRWRVLPALVLVLGALAAAPAGAYQFSGTGKHSWHRGIWPPGGTLSVTLVDSPAWYEGPAGFDDIAEVRQIAQAALDVWASIPTADIRWEVGEVISPAEWQVRRSSSNLEDRGMLTITTNITAFYAGTAGLTTTPESPSVVLACHVTWVGHRNQFFKTVVHELGHCLGLTHAERFTEEWSEKKRMAPGFPSYWRYDPIMSYGVRGSSVEDVLTADDRIGASLLRPAPGWLETTGRIVGRVTLPDGTPANGAYVLATRLLEPEEASYSVGVFAEPTGYFEIGGLAPGDYQLLVRSPSAWGNAYLLRPSGSQDPDVVLDLRQALRAAPVRVRAGEFRLLSLTVRRRGDPFR